MGDDFELIITRKDHNWNLGGFGEGRLPIDPPYQSTAEDGRPQAVMATPRG